MKKQRGFTLIELMITLGLLAFLVLAAAPLTGEWMRGADVQRAEGDFTQAIGRAKASALRNYASSTESNPSAAVCLSGSKALTVLEGVAGTDLNCTGSIGSTLWNAQIDSHVSVKAGVNDFSCVCFDNKGSLTTAGNCASCLTTTELTFSAGNQVETVTIF